MKEYLPIFLQVIVAIGFAAAALITSVVLGKAGKRNKAKDSAYECGMPAIGEAQPRFSVKFYLVAMLFILFDIEIVFMYPWAVVYREYLVTHGSLIFWSMLSFVGILTVGYVYAIMKGALDWKR
ncbi:MAG TPA: NADH-quinone oxidoreductase subunit A [Chthoniobacter sp.]|nr:NADH-quinone oxidoreductase subunit A [Chthoniobacter sp.]